MEFTKDDYVVEGNFHVKVLYDGGVINREGEIQVTIKNNWLILGTYNGDFIINRDKVVDVSIYPIEEGE